MREIKFRAWWKEAQLMVDVECIRRNGSIEFLVPVTSGSKTWNELQVLDEPSQYELLQFTGLLDRNGKEIYEGDLFDCIYKRDGHDEKYEVIYSVESTQFSLRRIGKCAQTGVRQHVSDVAHYEVIGNIYENPELLKEAA